MKFKIFNFDTKEKSNWGNYQQEISNLFAKCREVLVESLGLKEGFIILFVRKKTDLYERIMAILKQPTEDQRGYYWGVIIPTIQEHFKKEGNFIKEKELHQSIKHILSQEEGLNVQKVNSITGEVYKDPITLSSAGNKKESLQYIEAVIVWASSYGIYIPEAKNNQNKE
jgi:hypothetical protein